MNSTKVMQQHHSRKVDDAIITVSTIHKENIRLNTPTAPTAEKYLCCLLVSDVARRGVSPNAIHANDKQVWTQTMSSTACAL